MAFSVMIAMNQAMNALILWIQAEQMIVQSFKRLLQNLF